MTVVTNWGQAILSALANALNLILAFIPRLFCFAIILLVGWLIATLVSKALAMVLRKVGFDRMSERIGLNRFEERMGVKMDSAGILFAAPVAGVIQAFLIAIWYEWHETHRQEFQTTKDKVAEQVEKNIADTPLDPEPEAKLLS